MTVKVYNDIPHPNASLGKPDAYLSQPPQYPISSLAFSHRALFSSVHSPGFPSHRTITLRLQIARVQNGTGHARQLRRLLLLLMMGLESRPGRHAEAAQLGTTPAVGGAAADAATAGLGRRYRRLARGARRRGRVARGRRRGEPRRLRGGSAGPA